MKSLKLFGMLLAAVFFLTTISADLSFNLSFAHGNGRGGENGKGHGYDNSQGEGPGNGHGRGHSKDGGNGPNSGPGRDSVLGRDTGPSNDANGRDGNGNGVVNHGSFISPEGAPSLCNNPKWSNRSYCIK